MSLTLFKKALLPLPALLFIVFLIANYFFSADNRDQKRKEDLSVIQKALGAYRTYNNSYPQTDTVPFGRLWNSADITYMKKVPTDPNLVASHPYCYNNFGNIYLLCAQMEGPEFRCPSGADPLRSCNTCVVPSGKVLNYNYCVYESSD